MQLIPDKLGVPFKEVSRLLDLKPVISYASTVLFNWALIEPSEPFSLRNIRCLNTITGSPDEAWFYMVSIASEALGGQIISTIFDLQAQLHNSRPNVAKESFDLLIILINQLAKTIDQMYVNNYPNVFYKRTRKYLSGWSNDPALPEGLHYGPNETGEFYHGASAAQSPLIQLIDIALGITHPVKQDVDASGETRVGLPGAYLAEMHDYMLKEHRECLHYLKATLSIKEMAQVLDLEASYNRCIEAVKEFRSAHIRMVSYYIVAQAAKEHQEIQGTGGSNPIPFLKTIRNHTEHSKLP